MLSFKVPTAAKPSSVVSTTETTDPKLASTYEAFHFNLPKSSTLTIEVPATTYPPFPVRVIDENEMP